MVIGLIKPDTNKPFIIKRHLSLHRIGTVKETTVILISAGKAAILQLYRRYQKESLDDADYIPALKSVIQGISQVADDAVGQQQVSQKLLKYAREQYVQWSLENCDNEEDPQQVIEEGLYWFDYIYEHEQYPE